MPRKAKAKKQEEQPAEVFIESAPVDAKKLAKVIVEAMRQVEVGQSEPKPAAPQFVAFAAFDLDGQHYEAGDPFTPPANLRRDVEHETLRGTAKRRHTDPGLSFAKDDRRLILPVKEM